MHHLTTMKLGACVGYTGNVTPHRSKISNHKHDKSNDGTFFYKNNYRWIIKCLDDGKLFFNSYSNIILLYPCFRLYNLFKFT